jgi:DNA-binding beta-propeller fold protein YncE
MVKLGVKLLYSLAIVAQSLMLVSCSSANKVTIVEEYVYPKPPDEPRFYWQNMIVGSMSVSYETEDSKIQRFITGSASQNKGFVKPYGIAIHKGRVFVSDPPARDVLLFDPGKFMFKSLKTDPNVVLVKPYGLGNDDAGNLYVLDQGIKDVKVFSYDGDYQRTIKLDTELSMPTGLAITPDGKRLYISQTGGVTESLHVIYQFDADTGKLQKTIGKRGRGDLEFNLPKGIALDKDGLLYVVDSGNFRVQIIDPDKNVMLSEFGSVGRTMGAFSRPKDIAVDSEGLIYVSDAAFGNFQIFNQQGQLLLFVGERNSEFKPGNFMLNSGIAVDEDGRVLMADQFFRKIDIFRPARVAKEAGYLGERKGITDEEYLKIKPIQPEK